jgi:MiaB/RimO family radical SAM methylthiotransferase
MLKTSNDFRVRVGMMNPDSIKNIQNELIESYLQPRIFKFLHVPVQSGDDEMLRAMGRRYTVSEFFKIIKNFRNRIPNLTISTDIIIGYPNETEEQFIRSMDLIEELKPNIVNITRFSARPKTPASMIKNDIAGRVIKARSRKLSKLRFQISRQLNESEVGEEYNVLITERVKPGTVLSRNINYLPIVLKSALSLGSWHDIKITHATDSYVIGIPLS